MQKKSVFKNASTTYYYSSMFFPKKIWEKVATLYVYVRLADDYVDSIPQDAKGFAAFVAATQDAFLEKSIDSHPNAEHITAFTKLIKSHAIPVSWVTDFLRAMQSDLTSTGEGIEYSTRKQLDHYIFGSAEVIGLMMCKLLNLPKEAYSAAKKQGNAMQYLNFIRDIAEDCSLNRVYIPQESRTQFGLSNCSDFLTAPSGKFESMIRAELAHYYKLQKEANLGFRYIPYRYRVPIATAAELYQWTAKCIEDNPKIVFEKKVKPTKVRIIFTLLKMSIQCLTY